MININARFLTKRITGLERYAVEISHALKKVDNTCQLLAPLNRYHENQLNLDNLIQVGNFNGYFWEQFELPYFLRQNGTPLLLNLTNTAPILYSNQITVIHDLAFMHNPSWYSKKAAAFFKFIVKKSAENSRKIITVSNYSKSEIIKYFSIPENKIDVIYSGIPSAILNLAYNNYPNDYGDYILSVSSIEPRKNLINLVEAFKKLNRKELKLIIIGIKNRRVFSDLNIESSVSRNIVTLGYVSDEMLVKLYKNAKLFVYISFYEGFGFPPLEAIACGCPTVVSNVTSLPEVCGNLVNYCDPLSIDEIKNSLDRNLTNPNKPSVGETVRFRNKFSFGKSAELLVKSIQNV